MNTLDSSGIGTRIVGVEGKHADHLTTTTAPSDLKNFEFPKNKLGY